MPRPVAGPRLYFDAIRGTWIIRDRTRFVRTGTADRKKAELKLAYYLGTQAGSPIEVRDTIGRVYFVSTGTVVGYPIKIGFTETKGDFRLRALQHGCPYPLVVLAAFAGRYRDENSLHRQFSHLRLCGEWFKRDDELLTLIELIRQDVAA